LKCFRRAFQFGRIERAGGKKSEEIVRIRAHTFGEISLRETGICVRVSLKCEMHEYIQHGKTFNTDEQGICVWCTYHHRFVYVKYTSMDYDNTAEKQV
jgi:hypothetical protein